MVDQPLPGVPAPPARLHGRRVLVPRPDPADPVAAAVRAAGGEALSTELVRTVTVQPATALDVALQALADGRHHWLAVTSARTVAVLTERAHHLDVPLSRLVAPARVAAVGPATARALERQGVEVDLCPAGTASAADLLEVWPEPPAGGSVLVPRSAIAAPTLVDGLRAAGWAVTDVVAYRTETAPQPDPQVAAALRHGTVDVVLLTSGSTAAALVELYGRPPGVRCCAIGTSTAQAAARAGLPVAAVAAEQTPGGLVDAAARALDTHTPTNGAHA